MNAGRPRATSVLLKLFQVSMAHPTITIKPTGARLALALIDR
jgi:hypothetical protein